MIFRACPNPVLSPLVFSEQDSRCRHGAGDCPVPAHRLPLGATRSTEWRERVCVCVCARERGRDRGRERQRETETERDREREGGRLTDTLADCVCVCVPLTHFYTHTHTYSLSSLLHTLLSSPSFNSPLPSIEGGRGDEEERARGGFGTGRSKQSERV